MPLGISENLFLRIVSALVLLPPVLAGVYMGGWWFVALLVIAGSLMALEWAHMTLPTASKALSYTLALAVILLLFVAKQYAPSAVDFTLVILGVCCAGYALLRLKIAHQAGWWCLGLSYVALPIIALWWLRETLPISVLWVLLIVWGTDVGGYFAGKGIGGPKLAPRISPKKTWAGLIGGMALSTGASLIMVQVVEVVAPSLFNPSLVFVAVSSALLAVWAQVGDLVESGVKRAFNLKDSGGIIPGHGGLLDRVDGLVFVAPAVALIIHHFPRLVGIA